MGVGLLLFWELTVVVTTWVVLNVSVSRSFEQMTVSPTFVLIKSTERYQYDLVCLACIMK